ncbi:MAG: DUF1553 domain-containing protein [Verrucomicrobiota bacterium]
MFARTLGLSLAALTVLGMLSTATASEGKDARKVPAKVDFLRDVRPIISGKCFACHGPDEESRKAKLRLDLRDEAIKDRKGTRAIAPGKAKESELVARITTKNPDDIMPPPKSGHPLTPYEIEVLKKWVEQGAAYADHWAFVKPRRPELPRVRAKSWARNEIDFFILQQLEAAKLKPSAQADRHALIRRLSLDLTGLPPTPQEVEEFVTNRSPDAYEKLVDRLLRSPAYGERWARMWLDLARYADSAGYGSDPLRLNIWPYRDWVINAFNRNLPYDQFTIEQMAGDLLPNATPEQIVATAFHRNTMTNTEGGTDDEEFRVAAVKDRIGTTMQVWMGLTMGCAQCHTHKFDPISQKEYYSFFAFFNQTEDNDQPTEAPTMPLPTPEQREKMDKLNAEIAVLDRRMGKNSNEYDADLREWEKNALRPIEWTVLKPSSARSGTDDFQIRDDGSVFVSGAKQPKSTYTVTASTRLKGITALRLEALADEQLPKGGPGRSEGGNAVVSEFKVTSLAASARNFNGRYVRIELPGEGRILSLAEVQVRRGAKNLALQGTATQSSTAFDGPAKLAVDGNSNGDFDAKSVTHTKTEKDPWWEVDLGSEMEFDRIGIWNRTDGGVGTRLANYRVVVLDGARKKTFENTYKPSPSPNAEALPAAPMNLALIRPTADFSQEKFEVGNAIDGKDDTGWAFGPELGKPHTAVFEIQSPVNAKGEEVQLTFTIQQAFGDNHTLGKFRLSATTEPAPVHELPGRIREILAKQERTVAGREELMNYFRPLSKTYATLARQAAAKRKELGGIKPIEVPVMRELATDKQRQTHVLVKGNFLSPGDKVQPALVKAFNPAPANAPMNRLGVAQWLVSRENPLTARVAVNRFWSQLFGTGIVETEEDFGTQGRLPSHPELLDWLAVEFMDNGWDVKKLLKTVVMSATYQQSAMVTKAQMDKDPRNILLSRYPRRRLDAETVRDQALALSGLMSRKIGGPSVYPPQPDGLWRAAFNGQRTWATSTGEDRYRRGLYTFWRRTVPYPSMAAFDAPSRENCTMRRLPTNTPLQALVTLNDPAFVEMAQALGRRITKEGGATVAERARYGLRLALARPPSDEQVKALVTLFEQELATYRADAEGAKKLATEPLGALPEGMDAAEQAAWTVVANVLLNLDGVLTKG